MELRHHVPAAALLAFRKEPNVSEWATVTGVRARSARVGWKSVPPPEPQSRLPLVSCAWWSDTFAACDECTTGRLGIAHVVGRWFTACGEQRSVAVDALVAASL